MSGPKYKLWPVGLHEPIRGLYTAAQFRQSYEQGGYEVLMGAWN